MKSGIFLLLLISGTVSVCAQNALKTINIIPEPVSIQTQKGSFVIDNHTKLYASPTIDKTTASVLTSLVSGAVGHSLTKANAASEKLTIAFVLNKTKKQQLGKEGYTLEVTPGNITIAANEANGLFYGAQTFLQLLPASEKGLAQATSQKYEAPAVSITDYPRFKWRGMMLDVSRHFFPKPVIKSLIDEMVKYKYNTFHWHLTDDQGWRIEIKGLPELTNIGAWRVHREGEGFMHYEKPKPGEKPTDGGFYTQDDIREIVQYAAARFVTILPEIDVPAHSLALTASYPDISCKQLPTYVCPGSPLTEDEDNVLCVANDSTYLILDKILTQIAELFPGEYLHIGGDEAYKGFWKNCAKCQKLSKENNLQNGEELQSYFIRKVAALVSSKGKKMIGWEEIMQGGLAPDAAIMSWTSIKAGIEAAKLRHNVIMTPWDYGFYMDNSKLEKAYLFNMVPDDVDPQFIMGGEACLWTENVPNVRQLQYMYWPRSIVLSELFWSVKIKKNWPEFAGRLETHLPRLEKDNIKYSQALYEPIIVPIKDTVANTFKIKLDTQIAGLDVYYSFDGTDPDQYYPKYNGEMLTIPEGAKTIRSISYRNGEPIGKLATRQLANLEKRKRSD